MQTSAWARGRGADAPSQAVVSGGRVETLAIPATRPLTRGIARGRRRRRCLARRRTQRPALCRVGRVEQDTPTGLLTVASVANSRSALSAFAVRAPPARARRLRWRERLERRPRLERIGARGQWRRDVPGSTRGRFVEVAVVGLPARAARLNLDGGRLRQRRQLELGGVEGVHRFCLVRSHRWRTQTPSRTDDPGEDRRRFPPGRGPYGSADPTPDFAPAGAPVSGRLRSAEARREPPAGRGSRRPAPVQGGRQRSIDHECRVCFQR
jgi:hypothetical protein